MISQNALFIISLVISINVALRACTINDRRIMDGNEIILFSVSIMIIASIYIPVCYSSFKDVCKPASLLVELYNIAWGLRVGILEFLTTVVNFSSNNKAINHKNYNFLDCDWFKKLPFSTNTPVKLL